MGATQRWARNVRRWIGRCMICGRSSDKLQFCIGWLRLQSDIDQWVMDMCLRSVSFYFGRGPKFGVVYDTQKWFRWIASSRKIFQIFLLSSLNCFARARRNIWKSVARPHIQHSPRVVHPCVTASIPTTLPSPFVCCQPQRRKIDLSPAPSPWLQPPSARPPPPSSRRRRHRRPPSPSRRTLLNAARAACIAATTRTTAATTLSALTTLFRRPPTTTRARLRPWSQL